MVKFPKLKCRVWLYQFLGLFTVLVVGLQLMQFHYQLQNIPYELRFFWSITLLGYVILKEVFRWFSLEETASRWGEFYVIIIIGSFIWMQAYNIILLWGYGSQFLPLPSGALDGAIEALILWVISVISALFHHNKKNGNSVK